MPFMKNSPWVITKSDWIMKKSGLMNRSFFVLSAEINECWYVLKNSDMLE